MSVHRKKAFPHVFPSEINMGVTGHKSHGSDRITD